jgi:hypothetical protein
MESIDIGQHLLMASDGTVSEHRAEFHEVVLRDAKVGGQVNLTGAKVAKLEMESIDIGQHLLMASDGTASDRRAEFDGRANLIFAKIGSGLDLRGAVLSNLDLTGTEIG